MTEEQINKVLTEINQSVPQEWRKRLFKTVKKSPVALMVLKKALKGKLKPEKRAEFQMLIDSGTFEKEETIVDERMSKKIDAFVERKIKHAIKLGKLPTKEEFAQLPFYQKYAKKSID